MFNPPSDSAVQDLDSIAEDVDVNDAAVTENVDDDGNEYLEFEIEDLDDSPYVDGEEEAFGRRRRNASNRIEKSDSGAANQQSGRRENKPRSRTEPRREEGDVRERPPSTRRSESPAPAAERTVDFEDGDAPRRPRRRRGRGRGRSKEGQDLTASNDSTSNSQTPDPVADEIGWVTPAFNEDRKGKRQEDPVAKTHDRESSSRSSRTSKDDNRSSRESSRAPRDDSRSRQSEANYKSRNVSQSSRNQSARNQAADEFEVNSIDDTGEQAESTSGRSRRRRRRGRKPRGNEPSPQSEKPILDDETFDDDLSDDISSQGNYDGYDDDDLGSDDFDSEEFTSHSSPADDRAPKRGRRPRRSAGRSREQSVDADVNEDTEKVRFPTWEEAISVLVETNIKNHSRSPNRGGGGGGRGRSGGGNRGRSH
jgi:ribonuclease E